MAEEMEVVDLTDDNNINLSSLLTYTTSLSSSQSGSHSLLVQLISHDDGRGLGLQEDSTIIPCKFIDIPFHIINSQLLITKWTFIHHDKVSYIEVEEFTCVEIPSQQDNSLTEYSRKKTLDVEGYVTAVSPVMSRTKEQQVCLVQLQFGDVCKILIILNPSLLHISQLLQPSKCYLFTNLNEVILNKGSQLERRVLTLTPSTLITPILDPLVDIQCDFPSKLVSYKGTVSRVLCAEGGVYELDNVVMFTLHEKMNDLGLRAGAIVQLSNVHFGINSFWKGFYSCCKSHLQILSFSPNPLSPYTPLLSRYNRLIDQLHQYSPNDRLWLIYVYITLKDSLHGYIAKSRTLLDILNKLTHMYSINKYNYNDFVDIFTSAPHYCGFSTPPTTLTCMASVSTCMGSFSGRVNNVIEGGTANWSYDVVIENNVLLVGHVTGSHVNGRYMLQDATGSVHVVSHSLSPRSLLIIKEYKCVCETITYSHSSLCQHTYNINYIIPSCFEVLPLETRKTSLTGSSLYFVIGKKNEFHFSSFRSSEIKVVGCADLSNLKLALKDKSYMTQNWYTLQLKDPNLLPYLEYGKLYRLTSTNKTISQPSYCLSDDNDYIECIEEANSLWMFHDTVTISELLSTSNNQERLVSFTGTILTHTQRLSAVHTTLHDDPSTTQTQLDISNTLHHKELNTQTVLCLQIQDGINSITVYISLNNIPLPLGMLPGTIVTCHQVLLKYSRSTGNPYCASIPSTCISLNSPLSARNIGHDMPTQLITLLSNLERGHLSTHNVIIVQVHVISVQHVSLQFVCSSCRVLVTEDHKADCTRPNTSVFTGTARVLVDDGTGEGHLYCDDDLVANILNISLTQWNHLKRVTQTKGQLTYYRKRNIDDSEENELSKLILNSSNINYNNYIKGKVRPFISKPEQNFKHNEGYKKISFKIGYDNYTTTTHQRLQLKLLSLNPVNIINNCLSLLNECL